MNVCSFFFVLQLFYLTICGNGGPTITTTPQVAANEYDDGDFVQLNCSSVATGNLSIGWILNGESDLCDNCNEATNVSGMCSK